MNDHANGRMILWWSPHPAATVKFAAEELSRYWFRAGFRPLSVIQAHLPEAGAEVGGAVVIAEGGKTPASEKGEGRLEPKWLIPGRSRSWRPDDDAFAIDNVEGAWVMTGSNPRSVLYACYALLEQLEIEFFAPAFNFYQGYAEGVPVRSAATGREFPAELHEAESNAAFRYRKLYVEEGWSFNPATLKSLIDWMGKVRMNVLVIPYDYQNAGVTRYDGWRQHILPELELRQILVEVGGHGYPSWLSPQSYPEFYLRGFNVFDVNNPAAVGAYVARVVDYLSQRPEIKIFDAWPPDAATWPPTATEAFGSVADAEARVIEQLVAAVVERLPEVLIEHVAYLPAPEPPGPAARYSSTKVLVDIAPYDRSIAEPIFAQASERNAYYTALIGRWRESFDGVLGVYEYYRRYSWHSLPNNLLRLMGVEIPYYHARGVRGLGSYAEPADWITYEASHRLFADLCWNAKLDPEAWLHRYCARRFGAARDAAQVYFRLVEQAGQRLYPDPAGALDSLAAVLDSLQDYRQARQALQTALGQTRSPAGEFIIERLAWNAEYAIYDMELAECALTEVEALPAARSRLSEFILAHRFDGIILHNYFTVRRLGSKVDADLSRRLRAAYRYPVCASLHPAAKEEDGGITSERRLHLSFESTDHLPHRVDWWVEPWPGLTIHPRRGALTVSGRDPSRQLLVGSGTEGLPADWRLTLHMTVDEGVEIPPMALSSETGLPVR